MSCILSSNSQYGPIVGFINKNDDSVQGVDYRISPPMMRSAGNQLRDTDVLWPRSSFQGPNENIWDSASQMWEWNWPATGVHVPKVVSGITKDSVGAVLAGATVQLFNTATGLLVDMQVSDSAGNYRATDPNAVNCFAVGYEAGSPDVAGTTKNNLTGV